MRSDNRGTSDRIEKRQFGRSPRSGIKALDTAGKWTGEKYQAVPNGLSTKNGPAHTKGPTGRVKNGKSGSTKRSGAFAFGERSAQETTNSPHSPAESKFARLQSQLNKSDSRTLLPSDKLNRSTPIPSLLPCEMFVKATGAEGRVPDSCLGNAV